MKRPRTSWATTRLRVTLPRPSTASHLQLTSGVMQAYMDFQRKTGLKSQAEKTTTVIQVTVHMAQKLSLPGTDRIWECLK
jgi:hypothetical protein